jgi:hypothetical protein
MAKNLISTPDGLAQMNTGFAEVTRPGSTVPTKESGN